MLLSNTNVPHAVIPYMRNQLAGISSAVDAHSTAAFKSAAQKEKNDRTRKRILTTQPAMSVMGNFAAVFACGDFANPHVRGPCVSFEYADG